MSLSSSLAFSEGQDLAAYLLEIHEDVPGTLVYHCARAQDKKYSVQEVFRDEKIKKDVNLVGSLMPLREVSHAGSLFDFFLLRAKINKGSPVIFVITHRFEEDVRLNRQNVLAFRFPQNGTNALPCDWTRGLEEFQLNEDDEDSIYNPHFDPTEYSEEELRHFYG